jgi:hypothetical protein
MLIEYGFRIGIETYQPTPVLARLDVHPERRQDITFERNLSLSGRDAALPQLDLYGNLSRRFTLYPGVTAIELRGSILDSGLYERQVDHQGALAVDALPPEICATWWRAGIARPICYRPWPGSYLATFLRVRPGSAPSPISFTAG